MKKKREKRKETKENLNAFKMYCKLKENCEDDIFNKIAKKFNKKTRTVYNWSYLFNWKKREEEIRKKARKKALEKLAEKKEKQDIRILDKIISNLQKAEDNVLGSLDGEYSVSDYEKLVKLYRLLTDESTENSTSKVDYKINSEDMDSLLKVSKEKAKEIMNTKLDIEADNEDKK